MKLLLVGSLIYNLSYRGGTSVDSLVRPTVKVRYQICDPWFTRQVTQPLLHGDFYKAAFS